MQERKNIAIVGAGPSGLMAAEVLATAGYRVTVYDHMPSPGRKLLIAGRGGLNLTHSEPLEQFLARYGAAAEWLTPYIHTFPPDSVRTWCEGLGQETFIGSSGRVFPRSMKAVGLLRAWLKRLEQLGVQYTPRHRWQGWEGDALRFTDADQNIILVKPDATLLALGGASWPRLGSDGAWTEIVAACGIEIVPIRPSNCGFIVPWSEHFSTRYAGTPLKSVAITHQGVTRKGEAMITAQGLEGGAIYALSASVRNAIEAQGTTVMYIDLRPDMPLETLTKKLQAPRANKSLSSYLRSAGFSPLAVSLLRETTPAIELNDGTAAMLAMRLKTIPVAVTATAGLARAISSAGGISRSALNTDFMLLAKPGVFAAGEMLDWEAPTGGYLLQACFSTAVAAAQGIARYCQAT